MDKLIIEATHNPDIGRTWVEFRNLTADDFTLVGTRVLAWEDACFTRLRNQRESATWPHRAEVQQTFELKPELVAEIQALQEVNSELYDKITAQFFSNAWRRKDSPVTFRIFACPTQELKYNGVRKVETAKAKYDEAIESLKPQLAAHALTMLEALNRGFAAVAEDERRKFEEQSVRLYANPTCWKGINEEPELVRLEKAVADANAALDAAEEALRAAKFRRGGEIFEEYLSEGSAGAASLPEGVITKIRERIAQAPNTSGNLRRLRIS